MKIKYPVIDRAIKLRSEKRAYSLGLMRNIEFHEKPQKVLFTMSRYKFVAIKCF